MGDRVVRAGILTSEAVDALTPQGEVFYRRLMSAVDDFGRYDGRPKILLAALYPLKIGEVTLTQIQEWLEECERQNLILLYAVDGHVYVQIEKFNQRVRQMRSKWPAPGSNSPHPADNGQQHAADNTQASISPNGYIELEEGEVLQPTRDEFDSSDDCNSLSDARQQSAVNGPQSADNCVMNSNPKRNPNVETEGGRRSGKFSRAELPPHLPALLTDEESQMAEALSQAMGLAHVPEGNTATQIFVVAKEFTDAAIAPDMVAAFEKDFYARKMAKGKRYILTLKILREDLPSWAKAQTVYASKPPPPQKQEIKCKTCYDKRIVSKTGAERFTSSSPLMDCPDCVKGHADSKANQTRTVAGR